MYDHMKDFFEKYSLVSFKGFVVFALFGNMVMMFIANERNYNLIRSVSYKVEALEYNQSTLEQNQDIINENIRKSSSKGGLLKVVGSLFGN